MGTLYAQLSGLKLWEFIPLLFTTNLLEAGTRNSRSQRLVGLLGQNVAAECPL